MVASTRGNFGMMSKQDKGFFHAKMVVITKGISKRDQG